MYSMSAAFHKLQSIRALIKPFDTYNVPGLSQEIQAQRVWVIFWVKTWKSRDLNSIYWCESKTPSTPSIVIIKN